MCVIAPLGWIILCHCKHIWFCVCDSQYNLQKVFHSPTFCLDLDNVNTRGTGKLCRNVKRGCLSFPFMCRLSAAHYSVWCRFIIHWMKSTQDKMEWLELKGSGLDPPMSKVYLYCQPGTRHPNLTCSSMACTRSHCNPFGERFLLNSNSKKSVW